MKNLKEYCVLYRIESIMTPLDAPFGFMCMADDVDHAEEQCINSYPDADIVWVFSQIPSTSYAAALDDYYSVGLN
jgi:hypothetical protein